MAKYPEVKDPDLIGEYPGLVKSGGGYVWDDVLNIEFGAILKTEHQTQKKENDYYYPFATYEEALEYSKNNAGCEPPIALVLQEEYINEPEPGKYEHVKERRLTEWHVEFLQRPRRTYKTIPDFFSPDAPANRLDILRGLA